MHSLDLSALQYGSARGASPQSLLPGSWPSRWGTVASMSLRRNQESLSCSGASGELAIEGLLLGLYKPKPASSLLNSIKLFFCDFAEG